MKKRSIAVLLVLLVSASLHAQKNKALTNDDVRNFFQSTTHVVNTGDNMIQDAILLNAAKASWTVTPLATGEYDYANPQQSFLIITKDVFEKDKNHHDYRFVALLQGRKGAKNDVADLPWMVSLPLSCDSEDASVDTDLVIALLVSAIQNHVLLIKDKPELAKSSLNKLYNGNVKELAGKTIYMLSEDVSTGVNKDKLVERFDGHLKLADADEIEKHIQNKTPDVVVALATKGGFCYKMLVGVDDGRIYYYDRHKVITYVSPAGFLQTDISRIIAPFKK